MDRLIVGICPLEVQRACGGLAEDGSPAAGMLAHPWVGRGQAATLFEPLPPGRQKASRRDARGLHAPTPCGATRPGSGGRHIGAGHWVGAAERRPLFDNSGRRGP